MRKKNRRGYILKLDPSGFGSGEGGEVGVGSQEEVPVDQETGAAAGDSGHDRSFRSKNRSFHPLRLAHPCAEAERLTQDPHFSSPAS